ncbi:MAG: pyridoxal-phosphate dependent enzyme, partial [Deltaproteobacteria bacterium]|nr:pyridoxal-phosphate dependent enzyme [Deltaproteobacteria bacterium]
TETGAGQWGSALSFACSQFGIECKVFMVRVSFDQKPYRKSMMEAWGGKCVASPSTETNAGRNALENDPDTPGSLGIAISEAIEAAVSDESGKTRYSLGSVLNHVMLHQTIIGLEAKKQLEKIGEYPDVVIACAGGGSNFAGLAFPFVHDKINGKNIDSLGHAFVPPPIHAGGLRYHGMSPTVSQLVNEGIIEAKSVTQLDAYKAGVIFTRTEGFIPAPETNHALAGVIEEAKKAKEEAKEKVILFNWSGHGLIDLTAYDKYFAGELHNFVLTDTEMSASEKVFENFPKPQTLKSR